MKSLLLDKSYLILPIIINYLSFFGNNLIKLIIDDIIDTITLKSVHVAQRFLPLVPNL